jgi:Asparaginase, N-terminal
MLRLGRSRVDVTLTQLMLVDSLEMTDADRRRIVESCRTCAEDRIVVTHGTDTMVETAATLARGTDGKRSCSRAPWFRTLSAARTGFQSRERAVVRAGACSGCVRR